MKKRIAKKIYRRVYRSMMASFESFAFYHISNVEILGVLQFAHQQPHTAERNI